MLETTAELAELQRLLDASLAGSTDHLRSIVKPGERTLTAERLVRVTRGMCTLSIATVAAGGEPRISGVDGHLLHGRWIVGTDPAAAKARHLAARSGISAAHLRGDDLGVFTHGRAVVLNPANGAHDPQWPAVLEHLRGHYGETGLPWEEVVFYRIEPHWMVAYAADPERLVAEHG